MQRADRQFKVPHLTSNEGFEKLEFPQQPEASSSRKHLEKEATEQ
jgi:hypothetical protein